jgi:hypothetical protein
LLASQVLPKRQTRRLGPLRPGAKEVVGFLEKSQANGFFKKSQAKNIYL